MEPMYMAVRYLLDRLLFRARAALGSDPQAGALTLEWIVIAVAIAVAAGIAGVFFTGKVRALMAGLP